MFSTKLFQVVRICPPTAVNTYMKLYYSSNFAPSYDFNNNLTDLETKVSKIAIIGVPNAGKSTLINCLVNKQVFATSKKVHTTRCRAKAVLNCDETQLIFLDTPGLISSEESAKFHLEKSLLVDSENAVLEADAIGVIHDVSQDHERNKLNPLLLRLLHLYPTKESFLILNKIDKVKKKKILLEIATNLTGGKLKSDHQTVRWAPLSEIAVLEKIKKNYQWQHFRDIFMISSLNGDGTQQLKAYLLQNAKPGKWLFGPHDFSDLTHRNIIEGTVRGKLLDHLPHEVPYIVKVELEYLDMEDEVIKAVVNIRCKDLRQKSIAVGGGGSTIKTVAREAEMALTDVFEKEFHLRLTVTRSNSGHLLAPVRSS